MCGAAGCDGHFPYGTYATLSGVCGEAPPKRTREGAPEYWDRSKNRWVSRVRISGRGEVKRTKTLSRKPTDPDVRPSALSSPVPRQLAALHPPEALDPFSGSPEALASSAEGATAEQRPSVDLTALVGID